jgi:predicted dienelactone hydrolase
VAAWLRSEGDERVLVVANYHGEAAPAFTAQVTGTPVVLMAEGLAGVTARDGRWAFEGLGARGFAVITAR